MKRILVLGLTVLIFISGCTLPKIITSSEQPTSFIYDSDSFNNSQIIVSDLNESNPQSSEYDSPKSYSSKITSNTTPQTTTSDNSSESSLITSSDTYPTTEEFEYHNARTDSIYPSQTYYTPIATYEKLYYKNLDAKTQVVYRIIDDAIYEMKTGYIDLGNCTYSQVFLAFNAVRHDRPEYYWIPNSYFYKDNDSKNMQLGIAIQSEDSTNYLCTKSQRDIYNSQIKSALEELNSNLKSNMSDFEREVAVHEWLVKRVTYDLNVADEYQTSGTTTQNPFAFSSYGALVKNGDTAKAVCEGYSRALQLSLNYVGIECGLVSGEYNGGSHMWNVVKINNCWYHVDATGDDTSDKGFHLFLNLSTESVLTTHVIDADFDYSNPNYNNVSFNYKLPICNSMEYNYLAVNCPMISDKAQMNNIVISALISAANNDKTYCEFGFSWDSPYYYTNDESSEIYFKNLINLNNCVVSANNSLSNDCRISKLSYTSIEGCKGFLVLWKKT